MKSLAFSTARHLASGVNVIIPPDRPGAQDVTGFNALFLRGLLAASRSRFDGCLCLRNRSPTCPGPLPGLRIDFVLAGSGGDWRETLIVLYGPA